MKKNLLLIATFGLVYGANAQFTLENSPAIGSEKKVYVLDTGTPNYATIIGNNVEWDYSTAQAAEGNESKFLRIHDAADTSYNGVYATSDEAFDIEGFFVSYYTKDANGKQSQGFLLNGAMLEFEENVYAKFDETTNQTLIEYPFNLDSTTHSEFTGTVTLELGTLAISGNSYASVDGKGKLKLATAEYDNVLRYHLLDTMIVYLTDDEEFINNPNFQVLIIREQFEYYNHEISNFPLFIHMEVGFKQEGVIDDKTGIVLSVEKPESTGLNNNVLAQTSVYPNPANSKITIALPNDFNSGNVVVTDALGRMVHAAELSNLTSIDVSKLEKGTYFVAITSNNNSIVKTVIVD